MMLRIKFGCVCQVVSDEMFEYYGNMHAYCPEVGADEPLGSIFSSHEPKAHKVSL